MGFRAVNEGYRQSYGVINSDSEFVHLFGGDLDVDRSIVDLQGPEARAAQTEMKVRSMRLTLEAAIINGDDTFDPRAFSGLSKRLVPGDTTAIYCCVLGDGAVWGLQGPFEGLTGSRCGTSGRCMTGQGSARGQMHQ